MIKIEWLFFSNLKTQYMTIKSNLLKQKDHKAAYTAP